MSEIAPRMRRAAEAERSQEHHLAADLLLEAASVIEAMHEEFDRYEDEGGLPRHLPMLVTENGSGPCDDGDPNAHHWTCWCGERCSWARAFEDDRRRR